jgi:hypothetical protein
MTGAGAVRRIGVAERRMRLGVRHHLAAEARAADPVQAARDVVGLHGTDPASVFLAVAARTRSFDAAAIERELYDARTLVRMLGMRRTMFVVPVELAPIVQEACTRAIAARQRRQLIGFIDQAGIAKDADRWLREVEGETMVALAARGEAVAAELGLDVPRLREQLVSGRAPDRMRGSSSRRGSCSCWRPMEGSCAAGLAARGRAASIGGRRPGRGCPGRWPSGRSRRLGSSWPAGGWPRSAPGTAVDLKWWTGWTAGEVKRALAELAVAEVELDGGPGLVLAGDLEPPPAPEPWAALIPALDPTVMGWIGRGWFLGEHATALFDRTGNAGPTVWWDGRIVGGWAQRKDGEIAFRLLEDAGADAAAAVEAEAERLARWIGPVRVTPRFRAPLERELSA